MNNKDLTIESDNQGILDSLAQIEQDMVTTLEHIPAMVWTTVSVNVKDSVF